MIDFDAQPTVGNTESANDAAPVNNVAPATDLAARDDIATAPTRATAENNTTAVESSKAKGRKRAREEDSGSEQEDGPARRTRSRVIRDVEVAPPPSTNLRNRSGRQQSASPRTQDVHRVPQVVPKPAESTVKKDKGNKRAREDASEEEAASSESSTPAKKRKAANGTVTPSGSESEAPKTPHSTNNDASVVVASASSSPVQVAPTEARPRRTAPLRRHRMKISYCLDSSEDEGKKEGPGSSPSGNNNDPRSGSPLRRYSSWRDFPPIPHITDDDYGLPADFHPELAPQARIQAYGARSQKRAKKLKKAYYYKLLAEEANRRATSLFLSLEREDEREGDVEPVVDGSAGDDDDPADGPSGSAVRTGTTNNNTIATTAPVITAQELVLSPQVYAAAPACAPETAPAPAPAPSLAPAFTPVPAPAPIPVPAPTSTPVHAPASTPVHAPARAPAPVRARAPVPARARARAPAPAPAPAHAHAPAPAPGPTPAPAPVAPPHAHAGHNLEARRLRRHDTFALGDTVYKNKAAAYGVVERAEAFPTDWFNAYRLWDPAVRERLYPGVDFSSGSRPLSQQEARERDRILNQEREQVRRAAEHASSSRQPEEIEEIVTEDAMLGMAFNLLDNWNAMDEEKRKREEKEKEEEEKEEEERYEGKGKGKARDPRRRK